MRAPCVFTLTTNTIHNPERVTTMSLGGSPQLRRKHSPLGFAERKHTGYVPVAVGDNPTITADTGTEDIGAAIELAEEALLNLHDEVTADGRVPTAADLDALNTIKTDFDALRELRDTASEAEAARTAAAAGLIEGLRQTEDDTETVDEVEDTTDGEPEAVDEVVETEPEVIEAEVIEAPAPVAAGMSTAAGAPGSAGTRGSRRTAFTGLGGGKPPAAREQITAAGKLPTGQKLVTMNSLASTTWGRKDSEYDTTAAAAQLFSDIHPGKITRSRGGARDDVFAQIVTDHKFTVSPDMTPRQIASVVEAATGIYTGAADTSKGLTAALGWCAPPERLWNLLPVSLRGSYITTPVITSVGRGGLEFPIEPDVPTALDQLYADPSDYGFYYTEAQEIARATAATPKPCITIPCPDWDSVAWDIDGICITSDVLQDRAFPEFVQWWIDLALALHEKKRGMWKLAQILRGSQNGGTFAPGFGLGSYDIILSAIELLASDIRERYGVADESNSYPVEVALPLRAREFIRTDLRRRRGVEPGNVSNADIDGYLRGLNIRVQYLSDWQVRGATQPTLGGTTRALQWPTQMDILVWLPGTWTEVRENIVNLGRTVTPELARQNQALRLFTEDARAVFKRGGGSWVYTVPLAYGGRVGQEAAVALGGTPAAATAPTLAGASAWAASELVPLPGGVSDPDDPEGP